MASLYSIYFRITCFITDLLIINFSYLFSFYVVSTFYHPDMKWNNRYLVGIVAFNLIWLFSSFIMRLYAQKTFSVIESFFRHTYRAALAHFVLFMAFLFFTKSNILQSVFLSSFLLMAACFVISRFVLVYSLEFLQKRTKRGKKIAILGYNSTAERLAAYFQKRKGDYVFEGFFDDDISRIALRSKSNFIGGMQNCFDYVEQNRVEEIYSTILPNQNMQVEQLVLAAEQKCVRIKFVPDFSRQLDERFYISFVEDFPIITLRKEPLDQLNNRFKKRLFDVIFSSLVILLILSWLTPILALLIKIESKGPIFFKQKRSGRDNAPFWCLKFRSMCINNSNEELQAKKDDPRITKIGAFLRRTSLDELPQFFNVFAGSMTVVGPRPHMLAHTQQYSTVIDKFMVRHLLKPGITGWAQVNGYRGETETQDLMNKRVEHDLWYMENWSLMLDVKIVFLTIINMVKGEKNAY
jgi:putative colanic acid biosysnthesis UDP-glucose lipid carrier transferase